ncbi:MAG: nucleotide sugar dehydrogenase [Candidatus Lambdaproteobacteria bacterium]|nr:nucleotide sugar dehydrogenase [Candidatus Lambdaproteobacteria bacterium]
MRGAGSSIHLRVDNKLSSKIRNIACIGAGYVGGPTMAVIADQCPDVRVTVVDVNEARIAQWRSATLPVFEPGLDEVVARARGRNLFFEAITPQVLAAADVIFVCVNTPTKTFGEGKGMAADLQYWEKSARTILQHARKGTIVVEKSTVPVRTAEAMSRILNARADDEDFPVLSNPEFLAEGTAVRDLLQPERVLIGSRPGPAGDAAAQALAAIYRRWLPEEKILFTSVWSAELSKLSANAMLAQRISSINALSELCERTGADVQEVSQVIGSDRRIGPLFLQAGVGFGGSCFRKDLLNIVYMCGQLGLHEVAAYWKQVVDINDHQVARFTRDILAHLFNTVVGKRMAIFGFAFKPETDDTRDSPAIAICRRLLEERAELAITDPRALDNAARDLAGLPGSIHFEPDPYAAARGAHAVVLVTDWPQFRALDYARIFADAQRPAFVFDGRNALDHRGLFELGFNVVPMGKPPLLHR